LLQSHLGRRLEAEDAESEGDLQLKGVESEGDLQLKGVEIEGDFQLKFYPPPRQKAAMYVFLAELAAVMPLTTARLLLWCLDPQENAVEKQSLVIGPHQLMVI
jgi:hypothetical protein